MGAQRLSERKTRRIARATGLPVIRAWSHGGYVFDFVTAGHLHGWYDLKTGGWGIETTVSSHYDTCPRPAGWTGWTGEDPMFPDGVPPLTSAEQEALTRCAAQESA